MKTRSGSGRSSGEFFVPSSRRRRRRSAGVGFLAQGTLYPDVIESGVVQGALGGHQDPPQRGGAAGADAPEARRAAARAVQGRGAGAGAGARGAAPRARAAAVPRAGPGGPHASARSPRSGCDILREADLIVDEEIRAAGLYETIWQSFAVLLPMQDGRRHGRRPHLRERRRRPGGPLARTG